MPNFASFFFAAALFGAVLPFLLSPPEPTRPIEVVIVPAPVKPQKPLTRKEKLEVEMAAAGITCPECPNLPEGMERLYTTKLEEGPTVARPTQEYTRFLAAICESDKVNKQGREICRREIEQLEIARQTTEGYINPIYGRGPLSERQVNLLKYSHWWIERRLRSFEYNWIETNRTRYLRDQRKT